MPKGPATVFAHLLFLFIALVLLTIGAEVLVRAAAALALRLGISTLFIGLTIVGFGTSTPELATSVNAGLNRLSDISVGNVIGSNIFNIAFILGLTALIAPIPVNTRVVKRELFFMIAAAFLPFFTIATGNILTRPLGIAFLAGLVLYVAYGYWTDRPDGPAEIVVESELEAELGVAKSTIWASPIVCLIAIAAGIGLLVWGAHLLVTSSVAIAKALGVSELFIGLTIVAAGTSMPEFFTSLVAAIRKQSDISIGNIVGSNIFNVLGILGVTAVLYPQNVSPQILWLDTPLMAALSIACLPIMFTGSRISRREGGVFLVVYIVYVIVLYALVPNWS